MDDVDTADIDAQIAALEAAKRVRLNKAAHAAKVEQKKASEVLVGGTPTKSKPPPAPPPSRPAQPTFTRAPKSGPSRPAPTPVFTAPAKSTLADALAQRRANPTTAASVPTRTAGFTERVKDKGKGKAVESNSDNELEVVRDGRERDADLTIEHDLKIGPGEFGLDPEGKEEWLDVEPNSRIRLYKRVLPHDEVQDHLYGRYFLPPSQLYSLARLSRDGSTYDIPVEGDFVTIAVVAERGDIKVTGAKGPVQAELSDDEDEEDANGGPSKPKPKDKGKAAKGKNGYPDNRKKAPRKYINLKLVALPPRNKTIGSGTVSGDAILQLLLFESEAIVSKDDGNGGVTKEYRGGSGGAYEKFCNIGVGSVVALLNPRVLRPIKSGANPHPLTLPLALNPWSGDSVTLIGQAKDLGCCTALTKDGTRCKSWVDSRLGPICEYHVHAAVKRNRSSRPEFASASTSYELTVRGGGMGGLGGGRGGRVPHNDPIGQYNPRLKQGLLPRDGPRAAPRGVANGGGGATYIVGSGLARTGPAPKADPFLTDRLTGKRKRAEVVAAEQALAKMFEKNGGSDGTTGSQYLRAAGKMKPKAQDGPEPMRAFSAEAIKAIGYDPSGRRVDDSRKRMDLIASLKEAANRPLKLRRPPGPRRLNVVAPTSRGSSQGPSTTPPAGGDGDGMVDLD